MKISKFTVNPFGENTFILWTGEGGEAAVIDPGMSNSRECEALKRFLEDNRLTLKMVLLTHEHVDHIMGTGFLTEEYGCPVYGHAGDIVMGQKSDVQLRAFNLQCEMKPFAVTDEVTDGSVIELGDEKIEVLHTPGHSMGGVVYYMPESGCAFVGDTIFQMSIGRTDLAGGDYDTLINSIRMKLMVLPEETVLYPGHGVATTVGDERQYNPFLK
ncbi:MAG: MBL fold metallo-hydrolase [Muribaculaceae bacterium]|nr:MBL fold metallo-hydrolase [Muribaculaceae bacterium]